MTNPLDDINSNIKASIGFDFKNRALLEQAMTHRSYLTDSPNPGLSYERLEFLGDRVLGLVISAHLFETFTGADEGELSRRMMRLVRGETCAEVAKDLDLGAALRLGHTLAKKRKNIQASILADACESLIGALYLEGGLEAASAFILHYWQDKVESSNASARDPKTKLQEWAQARGLDLPSYTITDRSGPDHRPSFTVKVSLPEIDHHAEGTGSNKKEAEQLAAVALLERLANHQEGASH